MTEVVETVEQATEEAVNLEGLSTEEPVGKLMNFLVGIDGNNFYRVSSNEENITLQDYINSISTIEINTLSVILDQHKDKSLEAIVLYQKMRQEVLAQAMNVLVEHAEMSDEDKDKIRAIFPISNKVAVPEQ